MLIVTLLFFLVTTTYGMTQQEQFTALMQRSDAFFDLPIAKPVKDLPNRIKIITDGDEKKQQRVVWQAQNTRPIFHPKIVTLIGDFLDLKKQHGNDIEQQTYKNMQQAEHIERLLKKRPIMFMGPTDSYILRNNEQNTFRIVPAGDWEDENNPFDKIGTLWEESPFLLNEYISYDEMPISALIGVSVPTFFINKGDRKNAAKPSSSDDYEQEGIYMGLVGARFERANRMEWQHMLITKEYSTIENGYGVNNSRTTKQALLLKMWAKFYEVPFFPTYDQVKNDKSEHYLRICDKNMSDDDVYLNIDIYKKRMLLSIAPFFYDANMRGCQAQKSAYCHIVGLGLGVWAIDTKQSEFMLDVYYDIISSNAFEHISDIDFSWFPSDSQSYWNSKPTLNNNINIIFSRRNPADKFTGKNTGKLLVAMYAWDGNSYPGNEYWCPALCASGDPASACCSTTAELQNPDINEDMINNIPDVIECTRQAQYPSFECLVFKHKQYSFLSIVTQKLLFIGSILIIPLLLYCYKKGILTKP